MYTLCWVTRTMQINEEGYELQASQMTEHMFDFYEGSRK